MMLIRSKVEVVVFPAASVHVPITDWLLPALVSVALSGLVPSLVMGDALVASSVETPELPSEHENVTVTFWFVFVPGGR